MGESRAMAAGVYKLPPSPASSQAGVKREGKERKGRGVEVPCMEE